MKEYKIKSTSTRRRNNCVETLQYFFWHYFYFEAEREGAISGFVGLVKHDALLASDYLYCLRKFNKNLPGNLEEFLYEHGRIRLYKDDELPTERLYNHEELVAWMHETCAILKEILLDGVKENGYRGKIDLGE